MEPETTAEYPGPSTRSASDRKGSITSEVSSGAAAAEAATAAESPEPATTAAATEHSSEATAGAAEATAPAWSPEDIRSPTTPAASPRSITTRSTARRDVGDDDDRDDDDCEDERGRDLRRPRAALDRAVAADEHGIGDAHAPRDDARERVDTGLEAGAVRS